MPWVRTSPLAAAAAAPSSAQSCQGILSCGYSGEGCAIYCQGCGNQNEGTNDSATWDVGLPTGFLIQIIQKGVFVLIQFGVIVCFLFFLTNQSCCTQQLRALWVLHIKIIGGCRCPTLTFNPWPWIFDLRIGKRFIWICRSWTPTGTMWRIIFLSGTLHVMMAWFIYPLGWVATMPSIL